MQKSIKYLNALIKIVLSLTGDVKSSKGSLKNHFKQKHEKKALK